MTPVEQIVQAYTAGHAALFVTGRSLRDFTADGDEKIRPILEVLRRTVRERHGMWTVSYSLADGLHWDEAQLDNDQDRRTIEGALRAHRLLGVEQDHNELVHVIRGASSLARTHTKGLNWSDGAAMRFLLLLEFAEHIVPGSMSPGTHTDHQVQVIELANLLGQSLALRASGNLVILHGREGFVDTLVTEALHVVRLPQPDCTEKARFLGATLAVHQKATFEDGLTPESVAHLTANTPNRGLESLVRSSHRTNEKLTARMLAEQKIEDVRCLSEGTLLPLDSSRVENLELVGRNITKPRAILERYGDALLQGDTSMPANVLLVGPPGTGKTDLAILAARRARAAAYQVLSPKGGIVGETERKARLQQMILREWTPNLAFADEITEMLPVERSDFDGDSGASRAVHAALLTALSDESRRGRSLLVATTNCPWRMGGAMDSRFVKIPLLHPLLEDFPGILVATARRVRPETTLDLDDERVRVAAGVFHSKGANPRDVRAALSNAVMFLGQLTEETVLFAAHDLCTPSDLVSRNLCDLWAIKKCSSRSYFPWSDGPESYPYPDHLAGIVDPATGTIHTTELEKRIRELQPYAKV